MNSSFKESFNYLVAFLAVLFGLSTFRDELASIKLSAFANSWSIIELSVPFLVLMIVATYLGALAMMSRNFTFRAFPLTRVLERLSYSLAFFGLIYPLLVIVVLTTSLLLVGFTQLDQMEATLTVSLLTVIPTVYASYRFANARIRERYEVKLEQLRRIVVETEAINTKKTSSYEIVMRFHQFTVLGKSILRINGYGISGDNSYLIGKALYAMDIFNKNDLKAVDRLRKFRNKIVHNPLQAKDTELKIAAKDLDELIAKLKVQVLKLGKNDS